MRESETTSKEEQNAKGERAREPSAPAGTGTGTGTEALCCHCASVRRSRRICRAWKESMVRHTHTHHREDEKEKHRRTVLWSRF